MYVVFWVWWCLIRSVVYYVEWCGGEYLFIGWGVSGNLEKNV